MMSVGENLDEIENTVFSSNTNSTIKAETLCKKFLIREMSQFPDGPPKRKQKYHEDCKQEFGVGTRAFNRAWDDAINQSGNGSWSKPGRPKKFLTE